MAVTTANRLELLQVADAVAQEKSIEREIVIEALEDAIQRTARATYGAEQMISAQIDRKTGEISLWRLREAVPEVEESATQIALIDAREMNPDALEGDLISEPLPPIDFGRTSAQSAKQIIFQKVRDAERERQYEEFKDRSGEIINGLVRRAEHGNVVVDLGRAEGVIRRDDLLPRETFRPGDRVRAYIYEVRRENRGPQIFLSRTHPRFMAMLFAQEVPEVYDNIIEIRAVARDPGSRAKIAVTSHDSSIDPVGACVGMRGSRVQAVVNELQGEKIDIIPYTSDPAAFMVSALAPSEVMKVVLDEDQNRIEVVVPDDQLSLAIGRRGQNVRLASQLSGWDIDILTEEEESERRQQEFRERSEMFMEAMDVDEIIAQLLVAEGFDSVEEIAFAAVEELEEIEGFDADVAEELTSRAQDHLLRVRQEQDEKRKEMGVGDDVAAIEKLTPAMLVKLGEAGVKTLDDLGDFASEELVSDSDAPLKEFDLSVDDANEIIMAARAHWFDDEPEPETKAKTGDEAEAETETKTEAGTDDETEAKTETEAGGAETEAGGDEAAEERA